MISKFLFGFVMILGGQTCLGLAWSQARKIQDGMIRHDRGKKKKKKYI